MPLIWNYRNREICSFLMVFLFVIFMVIHIYQNQCLENYKMAQRASDRCSSELSSVKYQLSVVTDYKNRIDKLLTDSQKSHQTDLDKFKDIMDNCMAMKHQSSMCQVQFDDVQYECKLVREQLTHVIKELQLLKNVKKQEVI